MIRLLIAVLGVILGYLVGSVLAIPAVARDLGQWQDQDPAIREWYRSLKQPDDPAMSCCGYADAYWADDVEIKDGKVYAVITDDQPDSRVLPDGTTVTRPHVERGTKIEVPPRKYKFDRSNPVGHTVIFLNARRDVLCYVDGNAS